MKNIYKKLALNLILTVFFFAFYLNITAQEKPIVVTSVSMISDMTKNIAGDFVVVKTIVPLGGDPHRYNPTPSDASLVKTANLILINGLTFEGWIEELIANSGTKANTYTVTKNVKPIESVAYKGSFDPHAWMAINNGLIYIKNIKDALVKLDPTNKRSYERNYSVYKEQLEQLEMYVFSEIEKIPKNKRVLITSHDAFQYYGKRYGIQLESILGISTNAQVQTSDIIRVSNILKIYKIPAVFIESTVNPKLLKQIAKDNNIEIGGSLYSDSLGEKKGPASTYYEMIKYNTDVIVAALSKNIEPIVNQKATQSKVSNTWLYVLFALVFAILALIFIRKKNSNTND